MSLLRSVRERRSSAEEHAPESGRREAAADQSVGENPLLAVGRGLFGAVLAFMAIDNFRSLEERVGYAEAKGAPMPSLSVPALSSSLLVGGLGIALWRAPVAAAGAVAAFFVSSTPVMHDFWAVEDPEQRQQEQFHFLKNAALLGTALALVGLGRRED